MVRGDSQIRDSVNWGVKKRINPYFLFNSMPIGLGDVFSSSNCWCGPIEDENTPYEVSKMSLG